MYIFIYKTYIWKEAHIEYLQNFLKSLRETFVALDKKG